MCRMNIKNLLSILTLATLPATAADDSLMRYKEGAVLDLQLEQEIFVRDRSEAIAGRSLNVSYNMLTPTTAGNVDLQVTDIKGSYEAHGMSQRLSTAHLVGDEFVLLTDGKTMLSDGSGGQFGFAAITNEGLQPAALLESLLPELPEVTVSVGTSWTSTQDLLTLQGWAWAEGQIEYQHEVQTISAGEDWVVVEVRSHGEAPLRAAAGREGFVGNGQVSQTINWQFDVTNGRVMGLELEQQAEGTNSMPQGEVPFRQVTHIRLQGS